GKASEIGPKLKQAGFGKVEVVHYLEPVSGVERAQERAAQPATAAVVPAEAMEGRRLLDLALKARGGAAAIAKVKTLALTGRGTLTAQGQVSPVTVEMREIHGQSVRQDLEIGSERLTQVYTEGRGF